MLLNEILSNIPSFDYSGEADLNIKSINGTPYSFYVNEADPQQSNGMTFSLSSMDDDGLTWEINLGEPTVTSHGQYVDDSDIGQQGYDDVKWGRVPSEQTDVHVSGSTTNEKLNNISDQITKQLEQITQVKNPSDQESQITSIFTQALQYINQQ